MKKKAKIVLICFLCAVICFGSIVLGQVLYIMNCSYSIGSRIVVDRQNYTLNVDDDKDIRILQISDTQITALGDALKSFGFIKRIVEKAKPDLIVLTGDNLMNDSSESMLNHYIYFFDKFEIPWAPVLGNHDYNADIELDRQAELYENGKYCLFRKGEVENSYGNYYYNISRNNQKVYSLVFMDNAVKLGQEHLDWYSNTIQTITQSTGKMLPSWTFFHKPLLETYYAYVDSVNNDIELEGVRRERIAFLFDDAGFFDLAKQIGSTTAIIYGHNHRNNYACDYQNIILSFGTKTGHAAYHDDDLLGGNLYILKNDNSFEIERILI